MDTTTFYSFVIIILLYWYMTRNMAKFLGGPQAPLFSSPPGTVGVPKTFYNPQPTNVSNFLGGPQNPLFSAPMGSAGGPRDTYLTPIPVSPQF